MDDVIQFTSEFNRPCFAHWRNTHVSFADFVGQNIDKIARKVRRAAGDEHDEGDVLAELEVAKFLLVKGHAVIEYEPFGTGDANPDLRVSQRAESCCIEVKRIRRSDANTRQSKFLTELVECLSAVPSNLGFSIDNYQLDADSKYVSHFSKNKERIFDDCRAAVFEYSGRDKLGCPSTFIVPNAGGLEITFYRCDDKDPSRPASYFGGVEPVIFKDAQDEWKKYSDKLCECLRQFRPNTANVLALRITSSTHRPSGLFEAVRSIDRLVREGDQGFFQRKGFESIDDFRHQFAKLSAVCVIPHLMTETTLWKNPAAMHPLSASLATLFRFVLE